MGPGQARGVGMIVGHRQINAACARVTDMTWFCDGLYFSENKGETFMTNDQLIEGLNQILEQEHACAIRYNTHAAMIKGPYADVIAARLREIAEDEIRHADMLRERIIALGGEPSMQVSVEDLKHAYTLEEMLDINIEEEKEAIAKYLEIFQNIPPSNAILYKTIQELIEDEQEHLEELENLME